MFVVENTGDAPLTRLWSIALRAARSVASLSINAPALVTLAVSVLSESSSTFIKVRTSLSVSCSESPVPAVILPKILFVTTFETTSTAPPPASHVELIPSVTRTYPACGLPPICEDLNCRKAAPTTSSDVWSIYRYTPAESAITIRIAVSTFFISLVYHL